MMPFTSRALVLASSLAAGLSLAACGATPLDEPVFGGAGTSGPAGASPGNAGGTGQAGGGGQAGTGGVVNPGHVLGCSTPLLTDADRGRWIAFDSDRANFHRQLFKMHPDGSGVTQLLTDTSIDKEPTFSPDGALVAFTSDRSGGSQIFLLELVTGSVKQLTNLPAGADQPSFSHDGKLVTFHSGPSIFVVSAGGGGATLVGTGDDTFNAYMWPHFSVDDTELVFDRNNEINAINIQSHAFRRIVQNWTTTEKSPAVSPDGSAVAYQVFCESGGLSIWTTPFSTVTDPCKGRRVTPPREGDSQRPAWGTSALLAYEMVDKATNLGAIALISREAGSQPCVLTSAGSDNRNPAWSP